MKSYEQLRAEFTNPKFREMLKKEKGDVCAGCGNTEHIEYHHIVPLKNGGDNRLSNIVPLCCFCHGKAHNKIVKNTSKNGRHHKKTYEECLPYIAAYFNLEIGASECREKCGYSTKKKGLTGIAYVDRYKEENNIPDNFYNPIDRLAVQEQINNTKKNKKKIKPSV